MENITRVELLPGDPHTSTPRTDGPGDEPVGHPDHSFRTARRRDNLVLREWCRQQCGEVRPHRCGKTSNRSGYRQLRRQYVFWRDQGVCWLCDGRVGRHQEWTLDHVVPKSHGGLDLLDNLSLAHEWCNSRRESRTVTEWRQLLARLESHAGQDTRTGRHEKLLRR